MRLSSRFPSLPLPLLLFLFARIPLLLALPFDGLRGYGDLIHFFNLADIPGWPFFHFWIEYPPGFAFLNEGLYLLAGGVEHAFTYLFVGVLLLADLGSLVLFGRIEKILHPLRTQPSRRSLIYAAVLAGLPYAWTYYDPMAVFFGLLTLYLVLTQRSALLTGCALGAGILIKLFPALLIPALLRFLPVRRAVLIAGVGLAWLVAPYVILQTVSPVFTAASLESASSHGSVATIWAVIDGNYWSGGFGPLVERLDPAKAAYTFRNPPVIPPLAVLAVFAALGGFLFLKARLNNPHRLLAFYGLTLVVFLLWMVSWSPQWILHLLPLMLLVLPLSPGLLLTAALVLVNLLEWPLLLSRGLFETYPITIGLRFFILLLLGVSFYQETNHPGASPLPE